jgi:hypothetical protein
MVFFRRSSSPLSGLRDLRQFLSGKNEHRLLFAALSIGLVAVFFVLIALQFTHRGTYREPEVTYVTQWPGTRSAAEVRAQQIKDAPAERAERKRQEAEAAKRREQYRKAGEALKSLGM